MTYEERNELLNDPSFTSQCRIALCDWAKYWASAGTDSIQDPTIRSYTESFIREVIDHLDDCAAKVAVFAIADDHITSSEPSDANVKSAIDAIMATSLKYLM